MPRRLRRRLLSSALTHTEPLRSNGSSVPPGSTSQTVAEHLLDPNVPRSQKLIEVFLRKLPDHIGELQAEVEARSPLGVREKAHKVKGSCLALGAVSMAEIAEDLEERAAKRDISTAEAALRELRARFDQVAALLRSELTRDPSGGVRRGPTSPPTNGVQ